MRGNIYHEGHESQIERDKGTGRIISLLSLNIDYM
jgi:hypothetical protein